MTALYIHIPFCKQKCNYCDFVSYAGKEHLTNDYIEALVREIQLTTNNLQLTTIYFGGGTPTLLEPKHFNKIISTIIRHLSFVISHSEITIEANPGTADFNKLKELRELGINRLSIGAQSFHDQHLKTLGRIHNSKNIFRIYEDARSAGFENINLDLIFSLPDQTLEEWKEDLGKALELKPEHLSTYNLQIEENTPLYLQLTANRLRLPNEETELAMYEYTIETLTAAGYHHYEISNFAKPGFECQHNINYWRNGNYIGIGAGAHSHINGQRWANSNSIENYLKDAGRNRNALNDSSRRCVGTTAQRDTLFLGLRMLEGLSIEKFKGFEKEVAELIEEGLLMRENNHYKLTRPGLYLGNLVFEKFV